MRARHIILPFLTLFVMTACSSHNDSQAAADTTPGTHQNIAATYFQAGAAAGVADQGISNESSAWYTNWAQHMCGVDRDGTRAIVQEGCDNLFYAALPCGDYDEAAPIPNPVRISAWPTPKDDQPAFKTRWIRVTANNRTVYVQWEDVGPLYSDDCDYVFGHRRPRQEKTHEVVSALDLSPAAFKMLAGGDLRLGLTKVDWSFIDATSVPPGPWRENPTTSGPDWH
jgi:hypothetical protein